MWNFVFFFNSILLGVGLAMDAFSVSLANGLNDPKMKRGKMCLVAGTFGVFQGAMPLIGWLCVHTVAQYFTAFSKLVPWIALVLLCFIGGKMLYEGIKTKGCPLPEKTKLTFSALLLQGVATSIDALSVGFTIAEHNFLMAFVSTAIIAVITFAVCLLGLFLGKKFGTCLSGKAGILGGVILIFIGIEIFITGIF